MDGPESCRAASLGFLPAVEILESIPNLTSIAIADGDRGQTFSRESLERCACCPDLEHTKLIFGVLGVWQKDRSRRGDLTSTLTL